MHPTADIDADDGVECVRVTPAIKGFETALATLVGIGDDPSFSLAAVAVLPDTFAD
jgi:hypothetical protein